MMQKFTLVAVTLFCFVLTIFGFRLKSENGQSHPAPISNNSKTNNIPVDNVTVVYPNPESGIVNLHCNSDLKSPISVKALNIKEMVVKSINSLDTEGTDKFKYVRVSTSDLGKGKYTIVMTDITGKKIVRKIFIEK